LFIFSPLFSVLANKGVDWGIGTAIAVDRFLVWGIPYIAGRICFQSRRELELLRNWLVYGTLLFIPIFAWEAILGPDYYLSKLIYGIPPHGHMVSRLGGWRPELFFRNGIECGTWIACALFVAIAYVDVRDWRSRKNLISTSTCAALLGLLGFSRTVYAYALFVAAFPFCVLALFLRRPFPLLILVLVVVAYCATRSSMIWDGKQMVEIVEKSKSDKVNSIGYRVRAENAYAEKVLKHGPIWGFGGINSAIFDWWAKSHLWPDGWWVHIFRTGGYVGLATWIGWFGIVPLIASRPFSLPPNGSLVMPSKKLLGFASFVIGNLVDGLQNMAIFGTTGLLLGAIVATRSAAVRQTTLKSD
jgi:hypothetical protein